MLLTLPFPNPKLNPNRIVHYHVKGQLKAKAKMHAYMLAKPLALEHKFTDANIHIYVTFFPPDRRKRDLDNLLASMKSAADGLALAFGVNDSQFRPITVDFGAVVKGGAVEIRMEQKTGFQTFSP